MNGSWFFDKNFTGVPDDCFDDALKYLDFPLEDVEANDAGEDWDAQFQHLVPPGFIYDENSSDTKVKTCTQSSQPKQSLSPGEESSNRSIPLYYDSSEGKYSRPLWMTWSPVSVLESSGSSSSAENPTAYHPKLDITVKRPRTKRLRPQRRTYPFIPITLSSKSYSDDTIAKKKQPKRRNPTHLQKPPETRKCTHCEVTKTPQWREGPMGPKTLCNACGVRYRSGRLFPEYRPAASPTFVPTVHSNSHRKVIEMRKSGWLNSES